MLENLQRGREIAFPVVNEQIRIECLQEIRLAVEVRLVKRRSIVDAARLPGCVVEYDDRIENSAPKARCTRDE